MVDSKYIAKLHNTVLVFIFWVILENDGFLCGSIFYPLNPVGWAGWGWGNLLSPK